MKKNLNSTRKGSALLIAILVMGVLLVLTLGLSDLVIREIRQTQDVVGTGKAYFAAESGVENALLDLQRNLPGYEIKNEFKSKKGEEDLHYSYQILNTADKIPFFDPGKAIFLNPNEPAISSNALYDLKPEATYNALGLHETVTIPLSSSLGGDVKDFLIEYYFDPDPEHNIIELNAANFNNIDILRWKIFGFRKNGDAADSSKTDAISDYYPGLYGNSATAPVCIGTDPDLKDAITPATECKFPSPSVKVDTQPVVQTPTDTLDSISSDQLNEQVQDSNWGSARQCYSSDVGTSSASDLAEIQKNCTIQQFIANHSQNYLVLTNMVIPDLVGITNLNLPENLAKANIYYRIVAKPDGPKLVRESAAITSDGFASGDNIQQSIDANIGLNSFLPVFHFSLYGTDSTKTSAEDNPLPTPGGL